MYRICLGLLLIIAGFYVKATEPVHDGLVKLRISNFKDDKAGAVSYTFDDGLRNQYLIARSHHGEATDTGNILYYSRTGFGYFTGSRS